MQWTEKAKWKYVIIFFVYFPICICREEAKYCYENLDSGCVQYEYPDESNQNPADHDDDEMDICTTPPPPSIIDESSNVIESRPFGNINYFTPSSPQELSFQSRCNSFPINFRSSRSTKLDFSESCIHKKTSNSGKHQSTYIVCCIAFWNLE